MTEAATTVINRDDYMAGTISHQDFYCVIADAIGRASVEKLVLWVASVDELARALVSDNALNNIPLAKWDRCDPSMRNAVARNAPAVMAISWSRRASQASPLQPGTFCWSLSDTVCTLKAAARRMVEESRTAATAPATE